MAEVTIALDAMGGDRGPAELVAGALEAVGDGVGVLLCGRTAELQTELDAQGSHPDLEIVDAPDVIDYDDEPAAAVRAKPGSSMVTACRIVREGRAAGAISAGSTGAMLAASLLTMGRVKGVHRPGIAVPLPARDQPCVLIDAGANSESRPENLLQFGMMGAIFAEEVLGIDDPCVGLLSVGEESSKGTPEVVEAHALLSASGLHFGGNCEGRDALSGRFQVLVADGFAGNVLLKGLEGAGVMMMRELREAARSSRRAKLGALLLLAGPAGHARPHRPRDLWRRLPAGRARHLRDRPRQQQPAGDPKRRAGGRQGRRARHRRPDGAARRRRRSGIPLAGRRSGQYSHAGSGVGDGRDSNMNRDEALERVRGILVEQLGVDEGQVTEAASFQGDLDADSLDLVELIMELEDQFGVKISDEDAQKIETVGQAVDYVTSHA